MTHTSVFSTKIYLFFHLLSPFHLVFSSPSAFFSAALLCACGCPSCSNPTFGSKHPPWNEQNSPPETKMLGKHNPRLPFILGQVFTLFSGAMSHLPSPHQRPSGHRLNLVPGYPSSTLRNKGSSTKREDAKNQKQMSSRKENCVTQILHKKNTSGEKCLCIQWS